MKTSKEIYAEYERLDEALWSVTTLDQLQAVNNQMSELMNQYQAALEREGATRIPLGEK